MKKRCTNSACRRVFRVPQPHASVVCPHCGRVYAQGAAAQVQVEIRDAVPGMKLPLIKALYNRLGYSLREARDRADGLRQAPVVLDPMSPEEALAEAALWQQAGGITRLVECIPGSLAVLQDSYSVVMTGWRPDCKRKARLIARQALPALPPVKLREAMGRAGSHPIVLEMHLPEPEARAKTEGYRQNGILAQIRKQRVCKPDK